MILSSAAMNGMQCAFAAGIAGDYLAGAAQHARACARLRGNLAAAWTLLGDALLAHHAVTPPSPAGTGPLEQCADVPCINIGVWSLAKILARTSSGTARRC